MSQLLLKEFYSFNNSPGLLTEQDRQDMQNNNCMILAGIMQRADAENGNGRIYPYHILEREINNYQHLVKNNRALGELDHRDDAVVNLANASHVVTEIFWDGKEVKGKVKILDTPKGQILQSLIKNGITLGISSRGVGSTEERGGKTVVQDDFQLVCFDFVSEPSTTGAFMLREGKNIGAGVFDKSYRVNRVLNNILSR